MNETNPPNANMPNPGAELIAQMQFIRQLSALRHDALMAALDAFRAEFRAEIAMLRARTQGKAV